MIIERDDKTLGCTVFDIRLRNDLGKMQYFGCRFTKITEARAREAELIKQFREWKMHPERKIKPATFAVFVNQHYIPIHVKSLMPKTQRDYLSICKKLVIRFGQIKMEAFERYDVESYLKSRYNEGRLHRANREFSVLKGIFTMAEAWRFRTRGTNPCKAPKGEGIKLKKEEPRFRVFSVSEVDRLLAQCKPGCGTFRRDEFNG